MEAPPLQSNAETLLMVDDEPLMTDLFKQFMTRHGFHVLTAQSGAEALALLDSHRSDVCLVITDMALPLMSGIDIANAVGAMCPDTPVLIATGHDNSVAERGLPGNVVGVVQKPYQNKALADRIREIIDAHGERRHEPRA